MQITRQQRINNVGSEMIWKMRTLAEECRKLMKDGLNLPAEKGFPAFSCTGDEVRDSLGENTKALETVLEFVLDGKSNKITKGRKV